MTQQSRVVGRCGRPGGRLLVSLLRRPPVCVRGWPCSSTTGGPWPPCRTRSVTSPTSTYSSLKPSNTSYSDPRDVRLWDDAVRALLDAGSSPPRGPKRRRRRIGMAIGLLGESRFVSCRGPGRRAVHVVESTRIAVRAIEGRRHAWLVHVRARRMMRQRAAARIWSSM